MSGYLTLVCGSLADLNSQTEASAYNPSYANAQSSVLFIYKWIQLEQAEFMIVSKNKSSKMFMLREFVNINDRFLMSADSPLGLLNALWMVSFRCSFLYLFGILLMYSVHKTQIRTFCMCADSFCFIWLPFLWRKNRNKGSAFCMIMHLW